MMNEEAAKGLLDFRDPYTLSMQVQPQDIDGLHHTNNGVYVDWCQKVAWARSVSLGLDLERYRALDRAMVRLSSVGRMTLQIFQTRQDKYCRPSHFLCALILR